MSGFIKGLEFVFAVEGGLAFHPDDPGGLTNYGVTQATYSKWLAATQQPDASVKRITREEAEAVYLKFYWVAGKCDALPYPLNIVHFDSMVQHAEAPKLLQRALGVEEDGIIGPLTLNAATPQRAEELIWVRLAYYTGLRNWKSFGRGWVSRMVELRKLVSA